MSDHRKDITTNIHQELNCGHVLIVDSDALTCDLLENVLTCLGFEPLVALNEKHMIILLDENEVVMVFVGLEQRDTRANSLIRHIKTHVKGKFIPVIILTSYEDEKQLVACMNSGADDFLFKPLTKDILNARITVINQARRINNSFSNVMNDMNVAHKKLTAALAMRNIKVDGVQIFSRSPDIISGDYVFSAHSPDGDLCILLVDFTGHGIPAAIGVIPVADVFCVMAEKGFSPEAILEEINTKLLTLLPTSMFMAACLLKINIDLGHASIWNGGMPDAYILDHQTGRIKDRINSKHVPLGIAQSTNNDFELKTIEIEIGDNIIMHTDGLTDAVNSSGVMFGENHFEILLEKVGPVNANFKNIVRSFNKHCNYKCSDDDATLVNVHCNASVLGNNQHVKTKAR